MSEPGYIVMPIQGTGAQKSSSQDAANVVSALDHSISRNSTSELPHDRRSTSSQGLGGQSMGSHNLGSQGLDSHGTRTQPLGGSSLESRSYGGQTLPGIDGRSSRAGAGGQEHVGPLKKVIASQDSLYKYLNWEDPLRTLGSYFGTLGLLFGLHYFPLTQLALKGAATILGIMSVATFAGQSFNLNSDARSQVRHYKTVPEDILNATLRDVHDFVQYAVVEAQRIVFGENLKITTAAFVSVTALHWLIKILPAFWLSVVGVTSLYVGTLVLSPRGREVTQAASARAGQLANTAAESGKQMAREGQKQAVQLSSQVQDTAASVTRRTGDALQNGKETVNNKTNRVTNTASNVAGHTGDAVQRGKETVTDQANRNFGTSGTGNENTGLPQTNNNATTREIAATRSNLNETHQDGALEDTTFTGTPRELGSSSLGSYNDTSRVGSTIGHSGTDHTSSTRDGTRHGDKSQSYGVDSTSSIGSGSRTGANTYTISNSGLGTTSSVETPLETPGLLGDAAAARAYMSTTGGDEYTHTPDYGAIGGAYNGHNSVDTKSASKQADNTPRYDTIDGNHDSRFDTRGSVSTGTNSREYANATQGH